MSGSPDLPDLTDRPGAIILVRHGEPALSRKIRMNAEGYREWWATYEVGGLKPGQTPPKTLKKTAETAGFVIASTRTRSMESAAALTEGRAFAQDPMFIEAPLPPPQWPRWLKLKPRTWGVIARGWWWFFNHHEGQETRALAEERAREAAAILIELASSGHDVLVIAHGFFNGMVGLALRREGWRCVKDGGFIYWAARRFEKVG